MICGMKKYIIFTGKYSENSGGIICLHYLAHLINMQGGVAYLCPAFYNLEINKLSIKRSFLKALYGKFFDRLRKFRLNDDFDNKILRDLRSVKNNDDWIVIYPEITFGNPLGAKHVVRWLLHNPGEHTGCIYYGSGELHVKYHHGFFDFHFPGSTLSNNILNISYFPLHLYNDRGALMQRKGVAYCLRKGKNRKLVHDVDGSILIDGKSHEEVASIFKRVKTFISYDLYTAYSVFAALCGCESIVIPEDGVTKEEWFPTEEARFGIAYGFEDLRHMQDTRPLLIDKIKTDHEKNGERVLAFINESQKFFEDMG
jgi:hypothetical protein